MSTKKQGLFSWAIYELIHWLRPIYAEEENDGHPLLVYTSFTKDFYLWVVWLTGWVSLGLNHFGVVSDTALVWSMIISGVVTYIVIAKDYEMVNWLLLVVSVTLAVVLYHFGVIDFFWLVPIVLGIKAWVFEMDSQTIMAITSATFLYWLVMYLYSVTFRKRVLSSVRRAKIRPFRGRKPLPIIGRIPDNHLNDVNEVIFGFGANDMRFLDAYGKELDRDPDCVGFAFYRKVYDRIVGQISTQNARSEAELVAIVDSEGGGLS